MQVVLEMIELREVDTARAILRQTAVFTRMKQEEPDRFLKLEHLCGKTYFDIRCSSMPSCIPFSSTACSAPLPHRAAPLCKCDPDAGLSVILRCVADESWPFVLC